MSEKQLEKLYYSIYPMNQCETQSKSYEETKELCETLEKEMISLMSPDLQAMFEDYKEYTLNLKQTEQRDAYIDGLAFGIRTISEAFLHIILAGIVLLFLLSCCFMVARLLDEEISMYGYEGKENWEREQLPDKLSRSTEVKTEEVLILALKERYEREIYCYQQSLGTL